MDKKIKVGLIGAGNIAQNAHIPAYLKQDDAELYAVYDLKKSRAEEVAQRFGFKHVAADLQEMVGLEELDAVTVCSWNKAHAQGVIAAAKAGKHILCEKPMALTVAESEAMAEAVRSGGVIFMMGFVNRFRMESVIIKTLADQGKFGEIYYAKTGIIRRRGTPLGWFTDLSKSGGGPVLDLGVHALDLTWYYMGKPKPLKVSAVTFKKIGDYKTKGVSRWKAYDTDDLVFQTEDSAAALIRFANGAALSVEVSWALNGPDRDLFSEVYGTKAGASLNPFVIYGEEAGYLTDERPLAESKNMFESQVRHFLDCIRKGTSPLATLEDGMQIQKILNGIYESARLGREIDL